MTTITTITYILFVITILFSFITLRKFGFKSVIGIIILRDVIFFGVLGLAVIVSFAQDLSWHSMVRLVLMSQFNFVTQYSLLAFSFFLLLLFLFRRAFQLNRCHNDKSMSKFQSNRVLLWFFAIVMLAVVINYFLYGLPNQLVYLFDPESARQSRASIGLSVREKPIYGYLRRFVFEPLLLFLTYKILISFNSLSRFRKIFSFGLILLAFIVLTWEGQKALLLYFVIFIILVSLGGGHKVASSFVFVSAAILIFFFFILIKHFASSDMIAAASELLVRLIGQSFGVYFYNLYVTDFSAFDVIHESVPAGGIILPLFGQDDLTSVSRQLMDILHPNSETANLFNTYYFGQGLIIFGSSGWILSTFLAVLSIYMVLVSSQFISRSLHAFGAIFLIPYLSLYVISLSGDLVQFMFFKIVIKVIFSLILISLFWKVIQLRIVSVGEPSNTTSGI